MNKRLIQVDISVDYYDSYDVCEVGMLQAQTATGWDIVSVEMKSTATINYSLQSI